MKLKEQVEKQYGACWIMSRAREEDHDKIRFGLLRFIQHNGVGIDLKGIMTPLEAAHMRVMAFHPERSDVELVLKLSGNPSRQKVRAANEAWMCAFKLQQEELWPRATRGEL